MSILITGFEPFGKVKDNPSQRIVEHLQKQNNPEIVARVLPVDYTSAGEILLPLIDKHQPDAIILLGVAQMREHISLERIAVNINDASIPDNDGKLVQGKQIVENAPVGYWSTLPLEAMFIKISAADIPVKYSNHAGAYLCNHVMYTALHYLAENDKNVPCGFIHVPSVEVVSLEKQIEAIELCIDVFLWQKVTS